jgi:excisionase family DNA binding protein
MPWVSIREASEMLKVSLRTVQRLVAAHTLSSRMEHGRRLVLIGADEDRVRASSPPDLTPALLPHLFDLLEGFTTLRFMAGRAVQEANFAEPLRAFPGMWSAPSVAH